jgi:outer membrane protein
MNKKPTYSLKTTFALFLQLLIYCLLSGNAKAQMPADTVIQLRDAVRLAELRYHLLKSKQFEAEAAAKNIDVVKYSRMPTLDATYQADIATANNLTGMYNPTGMMPISGPPTATNNNTPAVGSAASLLLNWQAVTFGERNARINVSMAESNAKNAAYKQALFQHKINVISAYLDLLLTYDYVKIHQENVARVKTSLKQSQTLVANGIKPGIDTALFVSELSQAKIELLTAQKQLQIGQSVLAQLIVTEAIPVPSDTAFLNILPAGISSSGADFDRHPQINYVQSQYDLSHSRELLLKRSYLPKINLWSTTFARGSGYLNDGSLSNSEGLRLNRFNYGVGFQLVFPILKYGEEKQHLLQQVLVSKAAQEVIYENRSILSAQQRIVNTTYQNSVVIAKETENQLKSGQYAFAAMNVRYKAGLVNFSDLMQAQYSLLKAELDRKKSYWDTWKALLLQSAVAGDENAFLNALP